MRRGWVVTGSDRLVRSVKVRDEDEAEGCFVGVSIGDGVGVVAMPVVVGGEVDKGG